MRSCFNKRARLAPMASRTRHFVAAGKGPDQQQVADIRAGDEKNKRHHREHDLERGKQSAGIIERGLPQRPQPEAAPAVRGWVVGFQAGCDGRDFLLRLRARDARLESYIGFDPARAAVFEFISAAFEGFFHGCRNPEMHRPAYEGSVKSFRRDADDGVRNVIEPLRLADDLWIAFEAVAPKLIADDRDGMSVASYIFVRSKPRPSMG